MITNGKDKPFGQSLARLPDVSPGIVSLFQPVEVGIIKATQINGRTQTIVEKYICTQGVRSADPFKTVFSKTGERIFKVTDIYFLAEIVLKADDLFLFNGIQYRVVELEPWTEYGFNRYLCIEDFTKLYQVKPVVI